MSNTTLDEELNNKKDLELLDRIRRGGNLTLKDIGRLPNDKDFALTSQHSVNSKRIILIVDELKCFSNLSYYKGLINELEEELGIR